MIAVGGPQLGWWDKAGGGVVNSHTSPGEQWMGEESGRVIFLVRCSFLCECVRSAVVHPQYISSYEGRALRIPFGDFSLLCVS